jgi:hypothetical protein
MSWEKVRHVRARASFRKKPNSSSEDWILLQKIEFFLALSVKTDTIRSVSLHSQRAWKKSQESRKLLTLWWKTLRVLICIGLARAVNCCCVSWEINWLVGWALANRHARRESLILSRSHKILVRLAHRCVWHSKQVPTKHRQTPAAAAFRLLYFRRCHSSLHHGRRRVRGSVGVAGRSIEASWVVSVWMTVVLTLTGSAFNQRTHSPIFSVRSQSVWPLRWYKKDHHALAPYISWQRSHSWSYASRSAFLMQFYIIFPNGIKWRTWNDLVGVGLASQNKDI